MDDAEILARIHELVTEQHERRDQPHPDGDDARQRDIEVALDQCWDLLRQRRAKREFGQDVDDAAVRPPGEVETYLQ